MRKAHSTLASAFREVWLNPDRHDRIALQDEAESLTYPQLFEAVAKLAGRLKKAGVQPGARIALALDRSIQLPVALLATMVLGACPCPLEPRLGAAETARRYRIARLDWTAVDDCYRNADWNYSREGLDPDQVLSLSHLPDAEPFWSDDIAEEVPSLLLFTSGSSGLPKGVLQNHRGMLANAIGIVAHTELSSDDRLLHIMPLYHTNGVNNQILAPLLAGATIVLSDRFKTEHIVDMLVRHQPTILTGVPTIYSRLLSQQFPKEALASLRMLRCGSAPITIELHRKIEEKFATPLVISYGLSEATCTSTMNPPTSRRIGSVGTRLDGQDVFLLSSSGERLLAGSAAEGEICISGPALMTGYLDETSGGEATPVGSYIRTGDLGRFDKDGYLFITGRIKDVIIRGGENLSPGAIEQALCTIPGVESCCVVGRPDADLGEVPVAFVVRQGSAKDTLSESYLHAAMAERVSRIMRPANYIFVDALPENSVGKIDRPKLVKRLQYETVAGC